MQLVGTASVLAALSSLTACQDAYRVSVENRCDRAIEVDINDGLYSVAAGETIDWTELEVSKTASVRSVAEHVRVLYLWVRSSGSDESPAPIVMKLSQMQRSGKKLLAVVVGDLCPTS